MKTVKFKALNGIKNTASPERIGDGDLVSGNNVDIDDSGKIFRRQGTSRIVTGIMHSLRAFATSAVTVKDGVLGFIEVSGLFTTLKTGIAGRVSYTDIADELFWTDGAVSGVVGGGANRQWGITVPPLPLATAIVGELRAGTYLYTLTYARANGVESGAPSYGSITVPANSGVQFDDIKTSIDSTVSTVRLYLSTASGEVPYMVAEIPNGQTSVRITGATIAAAPVRTMNMAPPPPGQLLGHYNGRAYIGSGRFLWYSQPYEYELFDWSAGFIAFESALTVFAPIASGVFVGTEDETVFLDGADPEAFVRKQVAPYGAVLGTEAYVRNDILLEGNMPGSSPVWMSTAGLCLGAEGGLMQNLTSDRYLMPSTVREGASVFKIRSGTPQLITTLFA
jgi:hypothetical protein